MEEYIRDYVSLIIFRFQESNYISILSLDILKWYLLYDMCDSELQSNQIIDILKENGRKIHNKQ